MKYKIPLLVIKTLQVLEKKGFSAYIVGGPVRNLIMKRSTHNWDFTSNAKPEEIQKIFPESFYDNKFGTVGITAEELVKQFGLKNYDYKIGEVIIFKVEGQKMPIIHRVIFSNETTFSTKGDHNNAQWPYEETIRQEQILGKAIGRIPKIGWIKLFFVGIFK